jgi:hypothetical protein
VEKMVKWKNVDTSRESYMEVYIREKGYLISTIEYLFFERLFWYGLLIDQICGRKSAAKKSQ